MNAARPSQWLLLPVGASFALFAAAQGDVAWMPACFLVLLASFTHGRTTRWPARGRLRRPLLAVGVLVVAALAWNALVLHPPSALRSVPRMLPASDVLAAVAGLVLAALLAWTWHVEERRSTKEAIVIGASGALVVLSGNFYGHGLGHGLGQAAWATLLLLACAMASAADGAARPPLAARLRRALATGALGLVILSGAVVISGGLRGVEALLAGGLPAFALPSLGPGLGSGSTMTIERDGELDLSDDPIGTMDGARPPGYLRSQVFTTYEDGRWSEPRRRPTPLDATVLASGARASVVRPIVDPAPLGVERDALPRNVTLFVSMQGRMPLPYGAWQVASRDDIAWVLEPGDVVGSKPAGALVDIAIAPAPEGDALPATDADAALAMPEDVRAALRPLALEIVGDAAGDAAESARRIALHLETRHAYSLEARLADDGDPIVDFVLRERAGWCEHFAAAMALLLRSIDVPARVVGGFHAGEWNELDRCWIVRRSDAHAWCEVLDAGRGSWLAFDPTPPSATAQRASTGWRETWRGIREGVSLRARRLAIALRRVDVASAAAAVRLALAEHRGALAITAALAGLALLVSRSGGRSLRAWLDLAAARLRLRPHAPKPASEVATRCLERVLARVEARAGRIRRSETIEEYLERLATASPPALSSDLVGELRDFARVQGALRFGAAQDGGAAALATLETRAAEIERRPELARRRSARARP